MSKFKFKNFSIFNKLLCMLIFAVLPLFVIFVFDVIPTVSQKYLEDKQNALKNVVESAHTLLTYYNSKAENGDLTLGDAQDMAINEINALRYSGEEYYFMYDMEGIVMALGSAPEKRGEERLGLKDHRGSEFIKEMISASKKNGDGFVEYYYPKLGETEASPKLSYIKYFKPWDCFIGSGIYIDDVEANIAEFKNELYFSFFLATLVAIIVGFLVARSISKPMKSVQEAAENAASGNLNVHLDYNSTDEIGKLSKSFTVMVNNIRNQMVEIENKSELAEKAMLESEEAKREVEHQQQYLTENTEFLLAEMDKFSLGNLSVRLDSNGKEKLIKNLFDGFNSAVGRMRETIAKVNESVLSTASAAEQISSSAEEMAAGAQEQSAQTAEVAAAIEEMSVTISETTKHVVETNNVAKDSRNLAKAGQGIIEKTISGMQKIEEVVKNASTIISELGNSSEQIGEIVQVINDIADQTNLLALNAAIEAARAGENGRGFAVVADEVRKLAERTTKATDEIEDMIKKIQNDSKSAVDAIGKGNEEVSSGMAEATKAGSSMNEIVRASDKVLEISTQVAAASEQQSIAVEEISRSVEGINSITHESALGVQQIAGSATNLSELTNELKELVSQFRIHDDTRDGKRSIVYKSKSKVYDAV